MPSTVSTIICVCWWVVLGVITAPSFVQMTVVAGPPVEVQLRVLDSLSNVSSVMLGVPACKQGQELRNCTLYYHCICFEGCTIFLVVTLKGHFSILYITAFSCSKNVCVQVPYSGKFSLGANFHGFHGQTCFHESINCRKMN